LEVDRSNEKVECSGCGRMQEVAKCEFYETRSFCGIKCVRLKKMQNNLIGYINHIEELTYLRDQLTEDVVSLRKTIEDEKEQE